MLCLFLQEKAAQVSQNQMDTYCFVSLPMMFCWSSWRSITCRLAEGPEAEAKGHEAELARQLWGPAHTPAWLLPLIIQHAPLLPRPESGQNVGDQACVFVAMNKTSAVCHLERP